MDFADDLPTVFLDTSALAAVFDKSDQWHPNAIAYWQTGIVNAEPRPKVVLSDYIIDELATRIRQMVNHAKSVEAVEMLLEMTRRGAFALVQIDNTRFSRAWDIYKKYADQDFSFTDCTSFAICDDSTVTHAFTFDAHFRTYGITTVPS